MPLPWLLLMVFSSSTYAVALCEAAPTVSVPPSDAFSLLSFKNAVSHDPSNILSSWTSSTQHCHWYGVTCNNDVSQRIISLSLPNNMLSGKITESIGKLSFLEVLELQGNNFSGNIPPQISHLHSLGLLNLSCNSLSGPVPNMLIGLGKLRVLDLSHNRLADRLTISLSGTCDTLNHLRLSHNFLTGNIPPQIGKCWNLHTLLLNGNILQGGIPAEIGRISELRVLDVSRNSLTERIPEELGNCIKLSVLVLTNLVDDSSNEGDSSGLNESSRGEFNAFVGIIPPGILLLSSLQVLWAPRANVGGRLPGNWSNLCSLRVLNLGQNYIAGLLPESLGLCRSLSFLDLSSNNLVGYLPAQLRVPMTIISSGLDPKFLNAENLYFNGSQYGVTSVLLHDFSWNSLTGSLPLFSLGDELLETNRNFSYRLFLNDNRFSGQLPDRMVSNCNGLKSFSVNLSENQLSGGLYQALLPDCRQLLELEAAHNQIGGSLGPGIAHSMMLQRLDLRGNKLSGTLPHQLGELKDLKWMLLGGNSLTGAIPYQFDQLTSLVVLDLSHNSLTGTIPATLTNAASLETVLLDHNRLSGEISSSFSSLSSLTKLDVSFNNLSGHIPHLQHVSDCNSFMGNRYLHSCPDPYLAPPAGLPVPFAAQKVHKQRKLKSFKILLVTCTSAAICIVLLMVLLFIFVRRKVDRKRRTLRGKVVVTFADAPTDLSYDSVVRATGNFSIRNLIGTGGFGSTYKAELEPDFPVAVKRLSIGRFQGIQQFDAEIRTLGRIRHKHLVTLVGYYVGEAEMFLIYNYLSGGNLESLIHNRSRKNIEWAVLHKIASHIAQALAYLHYSCVPRIVHRDIKPSNILLDEELNAYLSDFGLARLLEVTETHATTDVAGTFGYVAPEYATTCRVSDKADVYSFGVVLLELISGKKSLDPSFSEFGNGFNIVAWAKLLINEGRFSQLFSPELWEAGPRENLLGLLRIASTCTVEMLSLRPSMKQVLDKLKQLNS